MPKVVSMTVKEIVQAMNCDSALVYQCQGVRLFEEWSLHWNRQSFSPKELMQVCDRLHLDINKDPEYTISNTRPHYVYLRTKLM